ncbi:MAG: glutamate--tRNA ligase [bacterium]|nr:MAG: glutamate--tRNA ligase [bacterium]
MPHSVRVRFAPSPTGYLHIGGVRTALYNWIFARQHGGKVILRIEDTDLERSTDEAVGWILDGLQWMHLDYDEGPFRQTERFDLYNESIDRLLAAGKAYRCYCTPEELEVRRKEALLKGRPTKYDGKCRNLREGEREGPFTIRFRAPQTGQVLVDDMIRGTVIFDETQMDDLIVRRSDGSPTYNLTVVVDDALMGISHVIRGEDHLSNTPRQIQLYEALGFQVPRFAHMALILGPDREKLSKRHGAASVSEFRDMGYLWEALVNYLIRLGWSHEDQEIFTMEEILEKWSLDDQRKSPSVFDHDKLEWLNGQWMKLLPAEEIAERLLPFLKERGVIEEEPDRNWLAEVVVSLRERSLTLVEMAEKAEFYFRDLEYDQEAAEKFLTADAEPLLERARGLLASQDDFSQEALHGALRAFLEDEGIKLKILAQPLRVALTYRKDSPGLFEVMEVLGKESTLERIEKALEWIRNR